MSDFVIEEVHDLDAAWPDIEPLLLALNHFHTAFSFNPLRSDWAQLQRGRIEAGPDGIVLLARRQDEAVGFINARAEEYFIREGTLAFIDYAYVKPEVQRLGIGTALVARVEAWCRARGIRQLNTAVVSANQQGQAFWTKAGFGVFLHTVSKNLGEAAP